MDVGELGAFVDTQGTNRRRKRRKKLSGASDDANSSLYGQEEHDEVEERLESLVFGNQPFRRAFSDSSSEEVRQHQSIILLNSVSNESSLMMCCGHLILSYAQLKCC